MVSNTGLASSEADWRQLDLAAWKVAVSFSLAATCFSVIGTI
jgi:hypothetical protein